MEQSFHSIQSLNAEPEEPDAPGVSFSPSIIASFQNRPSYVPVLGDNVLNLAALPPGLVAEAGSQQMSPEPPPGPPSLADEVAGRVAVALESVLAKHQEVIMKKIGDLVGGNNLLNPFANKFSVPQSQRTTVNNCTSNRPSFASHTGPGIFPRSPRLTAQGRQFDEDFKNVELKKTLHSLLNGLDEQFLADLEEEAEDDEDDDRAPVSNATTLSSNPFRDRDSVGSVDSSLSILTSSTVGMPSAQGSCSSHPNSSPSFQTTRGSVFSARSDTSSIPVSSTSLPGHSMSMTTHPAVISEEREKHFATAASDQSYDISNAPDRATICGAYDVATMRSKQNNDVIASLEYDGQDSSRGSLGGASSHRDSKRSAASSTSRKGSRGTQFSSGLRMAVRTLKMTGILPFKNVGRSSFHRGKSVWQSHWWYTMYKWLILLILLVSLANNVWVCTQGFELCRSQQCLRIGLYSDLPLSLGSLLGYFAIVYPYKGASLVQFLRLVNAYSKREMFDRRWEVVVQRHLAITMLIWLAAVVERARALFMAPVAVDITMYPQVLVHLLLFALSSLMLMALVFTIMYASQALVSTVDTFCLNIAADEAGLYEAVPKWNTVQAILRKGSHAVQSVLFVIQAMVLFTSLLGAVDIYQSNNHYESDGEGYVHLLVPGAIILLGVSMAFFKAAQVTDICVRVPPLINSCVFEDESSSFDMSRQYIVEYVKNSAAGFYVFEILLTSDMTLNYAYVCVICVFYLSTQVFGGSSW